MARYKKKVIIVKIPPAARAELEKFLERLSKAIASDTAIMRLTGDTIRIEVYGSKTLGKITMQRVRKLLREYSVREERGARSIPARLIFREAGMAVPLDVLEAVLRASGRDARAEGDRLVTEASLEEVIDSARAVAGALREASTLPATRTAKKLVVAASAIAGVSVMEAVDAGLASGALEEDDEGKLYVPGDWRRAVKSLLEALGGYR